MAGHFSASSIARLSQAAGRRRGPGDMVWVWARAALALPAVLACCCRVAATGTRSPPPIKKIIDVSSSDWFANAAPLQRPPAGHDAAAEVEYGAALFTHGKVTGSVDAFDAAMSWDGRVKGNLWQRGCAMYYTEQWVEGAAQFSFDVSENPNDTEESVWRWLCQARSQGVPYATANILNTTGETRPYMQKVYSMYKAAAGSGAAAAEQAVLALCDGASAQGSQGCFYSDMYYGLYAEAHGNATVAQGHLHRAGLSEYGPQSEDYMWWLTRVHSAVRGWPIRHAPPPPSCCSKCGSSSCSRPAGACCHGPACAVGCHCGPACGGCFCVPCDPSC